MRQRRIAGRYELLEQVGGSSWRAVDTELERDVLVQMPAREAGVARLTHPSIVQVFDQGEEDGESYAVLEYLPGGSLERRLEAGPLRAAEARRIAADVTAALAYAHAQSVTHGSLNPSSVLLSAEGEPKVTGFRGDATPEDDERALAALLNVLGAGATADVDSDVTAVLQPVPAVPSRRRPAALVAVAALVLLSVGVGAAFLATSGESTSDRAT
ncbi:MAG TPA: protein kinase, partial [Gaiellaceae bacterium]|nr:protein kinase [Gaiellaceae bacterium]